MAMSAFSESGRSVNQESAYSGLFGYSSPNTGARLAQRPKTELAGSYQCERVYEREKEKAYIQGQ